MNRRLLVLVIMLLLVASCGQKGPLFRPGQPNHPVPASAGGR